MLLLVGLLGWSHPFSQMGWFFTKAALLTFGGAYAVLPYVYQGAVVQHGWLNAKAGQHPLPFVIKIAVKQQGHICGRMQPAISLQLGIQLAG